MRPSGLRAFEQRRDDRTAVYSFEQRRDAKLSASEERQFRTNPVAWEFFQKQPAGYRRLVSFWVTSAKRDDTRARRLDRLIADSASGRRVGILERR